MALAEGGATQVEPGHGLTGTSPLHARADLPERPAMLYLSEVSHFHQGRAYCFGGGLYIDPVFEPYPLKALVGPDPEAVLAQEVDAATPDPAMIDYYGQLLPEPLQRGEVGDTVIFASARQAFSTPRPSSCRSPGIGSGRPRPKGSVNRRPSPPPDQRAVRAGSLPEQRDRSRPQWDKRFKHFLCGNSPGLSGIKVGLRWDNGIRERAYSCQGSAPFIFRHFISPPLRS